MATLLLAFKLVVLINDIPHEFKELHSTFPPLTYSILTFAFRILFWFQCKEFF